MVQETPATATPHRVVLAGYYGFGNLGDEVLLEVVVRWLRQFPDVEPIVLSGNPEQTRRQHKVKAVPRIGLTAFAKSFLGAKALIFGGGGIFQDVTSKRSLMYYTSLIHMARALGVPVVLLGQGLGPLSAKGQYRASEALKHASYVSVRDRHSFDALRGWGIANGVLGTDLAFSLSAPPPAEREVRPMLGLALVAPPEAHYQRVLLTIGNAVAAVSEALELTPIFLASNRQDLRFGVALRHMLPKLTVLPIGQDSPEKHLAMLSEFKVIWGSRMHALVLAATAGVPFVGLSYDPKVDHMVAQINQHLVQPMSQWPLLEAQTTELVMTTTRLLKGFHETEKNLRLAAAMQRDRAQAALADAGHHLSGLLGLRPDKPSNRLKTTP